MCYRSDVEIDLRGVRVACLSGDNGAGKSALLDCITWALWGKARVNSDRELIALNASEMEVTFGFELNGQEFRVTRRRTRRGAGPLFLDIQTFDEDKWRTISGTTARESQRAIDRLLKMDYDTFINSAFILQGRADEFTTKTPALRKQTLGEILNLADYDRFEEIARQKMRDRDRLIREMDAEIERIDQRLAELPTRRDEVNELSQSLIAMTDHVEDASARFSAVRDRLGLLEVAAKQRDQIGLEIGALDEEIKRLTGDRERTHNRIDGHMAILARREEIQARQQELSSLRQEQDQIGVILAKRQELLGQRRTVEVAIQHAVQEVQSKLQSTRDRIDQLTRSIGNRPQIEADRARLRAEIATTNDALTNLEKLRTVQSTREARRGELNADNRQLMNEMNELKAKIDQIEASTAICPVCRRELGPIERGRLGEEYKAEGTKLGNQFRENKADLKKIEMEIEQQKREIQRLEQLRGKYEMLGRQEASLIERLAVCERDEKEIAALQERESGLVARLSSGQIASDERARMKALDEQLTALPFNEARHREVQRRVAELNGVEKEVNALLGATASAESDRERLTLIEESLAKRAELRDQKAGQEAELNRQIEGIDQARQEHDVLLAELSRIERERGELQERFGAAQQRVRDLETLEDDRSTRTTERRKTAEELKTFEELTVAFGKRGIQAMIIENVVPELQDEANRILDKMPGNTMRVEFRTQRQTISGEGTIETLDIVISDEVGSRNYELYSGGEAFRVNFAIRVALSMLLARRAGARLQTLVVDEGFGTQDTRGRDGLIEAIRAIEPEFRMILVITHIAELKELFPTRIDVVKGIDGSIVTVN